MRTKISLKILLSITFCYWCMAAHALRATSSTPSHKVYFNVNGTILNTGGTDIQEGSIVTFPGTNPENICGKVFCGWVSNPIAGETNTAPLYANTASTTMGNADITYYAVFATATANGTQWRRMTPAEISEDGVYAIITADGHAFNGSIPGSGSSKGKGQLTTEVFGFTDNIATTAPSGTCEILIEYQGIKSGNRAYHMTNSNLEFLNVTTSNNNYYLCWTSASLNNHRYYNSSTHHWSSYGPSAVIRDGGSSFGVYSTTGGTAINFARKETVYTYSDFCTSLTGSFSVSSVGWATYYTDNAYVMPAGATGVTVTATTAGTLTLTDKYDAGDVVPANTPLLIRANQGNYPFNYTAEGGENAGTNYLRGQLASGQIIPEAEGSYYYYKLTTGSSAENNGKLGFYWGSADGGVFNLSGKNRAYLVIPQNTSAPAHFYLEDEEQIATDIEESSANNNSQKYMENGQVRIKANGKVYNVLGQNIY